MNDKLVKIAVKARLKYFRSIDEDWTMREVRKASTRLQEIEDELTDAEFDEYKRQVREIRGHDN